jgi:hypothetical protein
VKDDDNPFLAYSPSFSIEDSSEPFRAFLGAILSVHKGIPVEASKPNTDMRRVIAIPEEEVPKVQMTRSQTAASGRAPGPGLLVRPILSRFLSASASSLIYSQITRSSPHSPESFQVWVHLQPLPDNNNFVLPILVENGDKKQRLWLIHFLGSGSSGTVWQCCPDKSDCLYAIKVVESLCKSDIECQ